MTGSEKLQRAMYELPLPTLARRTHYAVVNVGHEVRLLDCQVGEQSTVTLVGPGDSDPNRGLISPLSPLGASLIGGRVGDAREILISGRRFVFIILSIR